MYSGFLLSLLCMLYCSLNGKSTEVIEISDRGLAYGDGVFTTAKIVNGIVTDLSLHLARLKHSCEVLTITAVDWNALTRELTTQAASLSLAVAKVIITAGSGGRGYSRIGANKPNVIVSLHDFPKHYLPWQKSGISLGKAKTQLGVNPLLAGIKHLNRLEQVLVRKELDESDWQDLIVCDIYGVVVETSCANIFWLKDKRIFTPKLDRAGVAGLLRNKILDQFPDIEIVQVDSSDLENTDGMIVCNSVMGCVPVKEYNGNALPLSLAVDFIGKLPCNL
ncbi:aminodeoxychorismate lyase [Thalassotalea sediminis]|uniref:aminodeoxychorismate lyase n=1 Tax=Thalassotalea sediminis TaxID=1759089 RepID=UPI0025726C6B|nr:aminodeoxychorismate lyase [Thalassotalea sediminis]